MKAAVQRGGDPKSRLLGIKLIGLFLVFLATPAGIQGQDAPDCKPTCTHAGCEPDEWQGIGNGAGVLDGDCWLEPYCHTPCGASTEEEDAPLALVSFQDVLLGLKSAETPEDLNRLVLAYQNQLVLNASQNMVLAVAGCPGDRRAPVSMVVLPEAQFQRLQDLGLNTLEALLEEEGER